MSTSAPNSITKCNAIAFRIDENSSSLNSALHSDLNFALPSRPKCTSVTNSNSGLQKTSENPPRSSSLGIPAVGSSHGENSYRQIVNTTPSTPGRKPRDVQTDLKFQRLRTAGRIKPHKRIAQCCRAVVPDALYVAGRVNPDNDSAYFRNTVRCENPNCPHCGPAKREQERQELTAALAAAQERGWFQVMVTPTIRHHMGNDLNEFADGLQACMNRLFSGRWWVDFKAKYLLTDKIKVWEVTYGANGWHVHQHILIFTEMEIAGHTLNRMSQELAVRWVEICEKLGFQASLEHGLDVVAAQSEIAAYIAKYGKEPKTSEWGVEAELTKAEFKHARREGMSVPELLAAANGEAPALAKLAAIHPDMERDELVKKAERLWSEHYDVFEHRPHINWGQAKKNLEVERRVLEIQEASQQPDNSYDMVLIERGENWSKVHGGYAGEDLRSGLLEVLRTRNPYLVMQWASLHQVRLEVQDIAFERWHQEHREWQAPPGDGWRLVAGGRAEARAPAAPVPKQ